MIPHSEVLTAITPTASRGDSNLLEAVKRRHQRQRHRRRGGGGSGGGAVADQVIQRAAPSSKVKLAFGCCLLVSAHRNANTPGRATDCHALVGSICSVQASQNWLPSDTANCVLMAHQTGAKTAFTATFHIHRHSQVLQTPFQVGTRLESQNLCLKALPVARSATAASYSLPGGASGPHACVPAEWPHPPPHPPPLLPLVQPFVQSL